MLEFKLLILCLTTILSFASENSQLDSSSTELLECKMKLGLLNAQYVDLVAKVRGLLAVVDVQTCPSNNEKNIAKVLTESSEPCGTFKKYNPSQDRLAPETEGFAGGVNFDGLTQYVGYGNGNCGNQNPSSGFILTKKSAPGAYISCQSVNFDGNHAHYLLNHKNLKWVKTTSNGLPHLDNALKIQGPSMHFMFGRTFYNGEYRIGKVPYNSHHGLWFNVENYSHRHLTTDFEVLVCQEL